MILVRQTFKAKFGKAGEVSAQMRDSAQMVSRVIGMSRRWRVLTDLSGPFDTVVLEIEVESLSEWEQVRSKIFQDAEIRQSMSRSTDLMESGDSQFFTIEDQG